MYLKKRVYFFDQGIRFECQQCGTCCTGDSGVVFVHQGEMEAIAGFLKIKKKALIQKYLYPFQDHYSIQEDQQRACLFYHNGCQIYPVRPKQCRTYPFWFKNLRSEEKWQKVAKECPGIGKGRQYGNEEILQLLESSFDRYIMNQRKDNELI